MTSVKGSEVSTRSAFFIHIPCPICGPNWSASNIAYSADRYSGRYIFSAFFEVGVVWSASMIEPGSVEAYEPSSKYSFRSINHVLWHPDELNRTLFRLHQFQYLLLMWILKNLPDSRTSWTTFTLKLISPYRYIGKSIIVGSIGFQHSLDRISNTLLLIRIRIKIKISKIWPRSSSINII